LHKRLRLCKKLCRFVYQLMNRKVNNIKELAQQLQLSPTTVSRVLNGKSDTYRISKSTTKKVVEAARKYHYYPNRIARGLKLEKTETIGLIIPDIANPYFGSIAKTIGVEAHQRGYSIILCDSLDNVDTETELLYLLAGRKVDGIIIAPTGKSNEHVVELQQQGIPVVVIDRYLQETSLPYVTTDNYVGALVAVKHLVEMNHKLIACIQGIQGISANTDRVKGYRDALLMYGIRVNEKLIVGDDFGEMNGYLQTKKLLSMAIRPTAVFALSNLISLGVLRALKEEGLKVPDDMSVVSFDEQPYSAFLACPMTTVEQPREEIGRLALDILLKSIAEGNSESAAGIKLLPRLIKRESVKKL
jgi:LacI family transcriptional regulator